MADFQILAATLSMQIYFTLHLHRERRWGRRRETRYKYYSFYYICMYMQYVYYVKSRAYLLLLKTTQFNGLFLIVSSTMLNKPSFKLLSPKHFSTSHFFLSDFDGVCVSPKFLMSSLQILCNDHLIFVFILYPIFPLYYT